MNELKIINNSNDLLSTYSEVYNGEKVSNLQRSVLLDNYCKNDFDSFVKTYKNEQGRTNINKLVSVILHNKKR